MITELHEAHESAVKITELQQSLDTELAIHHAMDELQRELADSQTALAITDRALHSMQDKLDAERERVKVLRWALVWQLGLWTTAKNPAGPGTFGHDFDAEFTTNQITRIQDALEAAASSATPATSASDSAPHFLAGSELDGRTAR